MLYFIYIKIKHLFFKNSIPNNVDEKQSNDVDDKHSSYAYNSMLVESFLLEQDFQMMMEIENNYR